MSAPGLIWMPSGGIQPPTTGLISWIRAGDGETLVSGKVSAVLDKASGTSWTQGADANRMVAATGGVNGLPYWQCGTSASSYLTAPAGLFTGKTEAEFYIIFKRDFVYGSDPGLGGLWKMGASLPDSAVPYLDGNVYDGAGASTRYTAGTMTSAPSVRSYSVRASGTGWANYYNGTNLYTSPTNTFSVGAFQQIGASQAYATTFHRGPLYEFLVYSPIMSAADRTQLQTYLGRYSITFA